MPVTITTNLYDELFEIVDYANVKSRIDRLWLGGTAGPSGGQGARPGGYVGQLIQTLSTYDTSEEATPIGSGSLLDNLNHIRYNIAVVSGILGSGIAGEITVRNIDLIPTISGVRIITFSGAQIIDGGNGEVLVRIIGGSGGSGASSFLDLTDTPDSYAGQANKVVAVNTGETGLTFTTVSVSDVGLFMAMRNR